jgi:hypothetical protein
VLHSEKNAVEILDTTDIQTSKNAKNPNKTHEMDVLEALENETLESHSRVRELESLRAHIMDGVRLDGLDTGFGSSFSLLSWLFLSYFRFPLQLFSLICLTASEMLQYGRTRQDFHKFQST